MRRPIRSRYTESNGLVECSPRGLTQPLVAITNSPLSEPYLTKKPVPKKVRELSVAEVKRRHQRFIYFLQMPMSLERLNRIPTGTLRALASLFKAYDGVAAREWDKNKLIAFIRGHQEYPEQYRPLEKIPGVDYPNIEDQQYRRMFESKIDPWKGPRRI